MDIHRRLKKIKNMFFLQRKTLDVTGLAEDVLCFQGLWFFGS